MGEIKCESNKSSRYCIGCIICGEPVELNELESLALTMPYKSMYKVCGKCREAVMMMRNLPRTESRDTVTLSDEITPL